LRVNGVRISETGELLEEVTNYWSNLYVSQRVCNSEIDKYLAEIEIDKVLNEQEKTSCEGLMSVSECTDVLFKMKKNKSPGCDGLQPEFYQTFWEDIKYMVTDSLNEAFCTGKMSASQRRGIITLMFKKGDREELKNWRPISLLNTDYKLAAFVISGRMQQVLSNIVSTDQTGYIKGRFVGSNIRLIEDVFDYINKNNKEGATIFCDFEKAFDSVEFIFLKKVLEKFNFGPQFRQWIDVFYNKIDSNVTTGYQNLS